MGKKNVKLSVVLLVLVAIVGNPFLWANGTKDSPSQASKTIKVGISMSDMTHTTFIEMMKAIRARAKELNVQILEHSAESDPGKLVSGLENFIAADCDAIIFQNFDQKASAAVVAKAKEKGIIVVAYDSYNKDADYVFQADNKAVGTAIGTMTGKWINENLDGKGVVAVCGYDIINFLKIRGDYIEKAIKTTAPASEIVARQKAGYRNEGVEFGEALIQAHPDVNIVVGVVDGGVMGVKEAYEAAGKNKEKIGMFGCDATADGVAAIKEGGLFKGTIYMNLNQVGVDMLNAAVDGVKGKFSDERNIAFPITPVTIENVDIIK